MEISLFCHWCDRYHFIFDNIRLATQLKKTAVSFFLYIYMSRSAQDDDSTAEKSTAMTAS